MSFALVCGTMLLTVTGQQADLFDPTQASQNWGEMYADHVYLTATHEAGVYENPVKFRLKIAPDHSRVWLNGNPALPCKENKSPTG